MPHAIAARGRDLRSPVARRPQHTANRTNRCDRLVLVPRVRLSTPASAPTNNPTAVLRRPRPPAAHPLRSRPPSLRAPRRHRRRRQCAASCVPSSRAAWVGGVGVRGESAASVRGVAAGICRPIISSGDARKHTTHDFLLTVREKKVRTLHASSVRCDDAL